MREEARKQALFTGPPCPITALSLAMTQILKQGFPGPQEFPPSSPPATAMSMVLTLSSTGTGQGSTDRGWGAQRGVEVEEILVVKRYTVGVGARAHIFCPLSTLETHNAHNCLWVKNSQIEEVRVIPVNPGKGL